MTMHAFPEATLAGPTALAFLDQPGSIEAAARTGSPVWLSLVPPAELLGPLDDGSLHGVWLEGGDLCWRLGGRTGRREAAVDPGAAETVRRAAVLAAARVLVPGSRAIV